MAREETYAKAHKHPEFPDRTVWEVFDEERPYLVAVSAAFDGYKESPAKVSTTALVHFESRLASL